MARNRTKNTEENMEQNTEENTDQVIEEHTLEESTSQFVTSLRERMEAAQAARDAEEAALNEEIGKRERELDELYALRGYGREGMKKTRRIAAKREGGHRIDWDEKLEKLPKIFSVEDMLKDPDIETKGKVQCYPAVQRWIKGNKVKQVERGKWRKLAA